MYHRPVMIPPALSPRVGSFPPMQYPFSNPNMQQHPPGTPLAPSAIPQGFGAGGPSFDPAAFGRGMPIGRDAGMPPGTKVPLAPTSNAPPTTLMLAHGIGRRGSMPMMNSNNNANNTSNNAPADGASSSPSGAGSNAASAAPGPITRPLLPLHVQPPQAQAKVQVLSGLVLVFLLARLEVSNHGVQPT